MAIKVALVEDDSRVRESLAILIDGAAGFRCTGSYPNAEAAIRQLPQDWPDVVLMDINLPRMSGIECVRELKSRRPALQIIMLTAYMDNDQIFASLAAGASGYVLKKTAPAKILESVSEVHAGGAPMSNSIARVVVQFFQQQNKGDDDTKNLTSREQEILTYLAQGSNYRVIGEKLGISALTVRSHIRNIYEKLHVHSRTEAVLKFLGAKPTGRK